jgi:hypothetical protein
VDGAANEPLSLAEAKARLRTAAQAVEDSVHVPLEPRRAMPLALLAGVLVGSSPGSRKALARTLVAVLFD